MMAGLSNVIVIAAFAVLAGLGAVLVVALFRVSSRSDHRGHAGEPGTDQRADFGPL